MVCVYVMIISVDDWSAAVRRRKFRESLEDLADTKFNDKWYRRVLGHKRSTPVSAAAVTVSLSSSLDTITEHEGEEEGRGTVRGDRDGVEDDEGADDRMHIAGRASKERFILLVLAELNIISLYNDIVPLAKVRERYNTNDDEDDII